ncbi:MAG: lipid-binding SYLF domain-containing protein, partial [Planctomycetaceae bacterium]|nr:lipid-binding SYLF domain-containing protein [Planctomycetaceae bacterium]
MSTLYRRILCLLAVVLLGGGYGWGASRNEVTNRLEDFRKFFIDFQLAPDSGIPGDLLAECYGVIIMRQYKAGFIFGARVGHGVIFMHDRFTGEWSPPAFVRSADGSFGFQIGGQSVDAIILIMNQEGVDMLLKTRFSIGVDASAAAGPVGRDMSAQVGPGTAFLTYSRAKGLYAGASFEGSAYLNNNDYNRALYGRSVGIRDILLDRQVAMPPEAQPIIATLKEYAVRGGGPSTPAQPTAGD